MPWDRPREALALADPKVDAAPPRSPGPEALAPPPGVAPPGRGRGAAPDVKPPAPLDPRDAALAGRAGSEELASSPAQATPVDAAEVAPAVVAAAARPGPQDRVAGRLRPDRADARRPEPARAPPAPADLARERRPLAVADVASGPSPAARASPPSGRPLHRPRAPPAVAEASAPDVAPPAGPGARRIARARRPRPAPTVTCAASYAGLRADAVAPLARRSPRPVARPGRVVRARRRTRRRTDRGDSSCRARRAAESAARSEPLSAEPLDPKLRRRS